MNLGSFARIVGIFLVGTVVLSVVPADAATSGGKCAKAGVMKSTKTVKYKCVKSGKSLKWVKVAQFVSTTTTTTTIPLAPKSAVSTLDQYRNSAECKIQNATGNWRTHQGFDQNPFRVRNNAPIRALMFPVDFPDLVGDSSPSDYLLPISQSISDYFKSMSDGRSVIQWTIQSSFARYPQNVADAQLGGRTTSGYQRFAQEATRLARNALDLSQFQFVVFAPPRTTLRSQIAIGPAFVQDTDSGINATMLDGQSYSVTKPFLNTVHEILHLMGVSDLYNFNAANESAAGAGSAFERQFVYMGVFDIMSHAQGTGVALTAWNRWLTDLIGDGQIRCLPATMTRTHLTPLEAVGGVKGAVIPLSRNQALVIESRRAIRYDAQLGRESEGVLLYKVDTSISNGSGPMRVVGRAQSADVLLRDAPMKVGESRSIEGFTIKVLESGPWGDVVEVSSN
jgi:M6 family metalloprotease-like protein